MTNDFFQKKQQFFDTWAVNYDYLLTTIFYQAIHKRLLEYVELPPTPHILDLGCGTGRLLNRLAAQFPSLKGIGLDLSDQMLRQARKCQQYRRNLIYIQGNAEAMPFADNQFDAVFNTISFLHYPNPQQVFKEVSRVLKPGGRYYLVDALGNKLLFNKLWFSPGGVRLYSLEQREELGNNSGLFALNHYYLLDNVVLSIFT